MSELSKAHSPRPQWRSKMGFILAALGSAVGLGNIWRFSYLCYENGGGAFLIPYIIALLVIGIPLLILELGLGHKMRGSAPMTFAKIGRNWEWLGWWAVNCAMFGIMLYYSVIIAWCLSYVFFSTNLAWGSDPSAFFLKEFLQISDSPTNFGDVRTPIIGAVAVVWLLSWVIVYFGVQKGVERANKIFMPLLLVLVTGLVIWSLQLPGAGIGIEKYLEPDFKILKQPKVWLDAFSQIFFTLSLAFGIMIAYASYLPRKVNIVKDAFIIGIGNSLFSIFAGFVVFGTLGYMATASGKPVEEVVEKAITLAFITYPKAISLLPMMSELFGVLFFTALVIAGLSSAVSLVEAFSAAVIDKFGGSRASVVSWTCAAGFVGSIAFTSNSGLLWLDIVDHFILTYGLVLIGLLQCLLVAWKLKTRKLRNHINEASGGDVLPALWDVCIKFIVPAILATLLWNSLVQEVSKPYGNYPWVSIILVGRDWLLAALIIALFIAMRPWKSDLE